MTPERHGRIGELLDAALDLEPAARRELIDRECADDPSLRAEIESLLDIEANLTEDFLATPAALQVAEQLARSDAESAGAASPTTMPDTIGPYRLVSQLGRGGMGTVYLAEQQQPVERRVALKVITGFDGEEDSQRLAMECRALARLQHPHVATVYDGGV
ncbi:MAG: protein kinase, partial [Acidobacteriota bacterium]